MWNLNGREENQYLVTLLFELVSGRSGEGGCDDGVDVDDGCGGSSGYGNPNKSAAGMVSWWPGQLLWR